MTYENAKDIVKRKLPPELSMEYEREGVKNVVTVVLKYLKSGNKILDFGAGRCVKTAIIQTLGYKCSACDDLQDHWHQIGNNKEKILGFAKEMGIDFRLIADNTLPFEDECYDMVMAHDVLEHLHNSPRNLCNDLVERIKPEGYFFISVPNAVNIRKRLYVLLGKTNLPDFDSYYWYPGPWRGHVREYTKGDLVKLAQHLHLEILELRGCHHMLTRLPAVVRPFYIAITSIFTGWKDSWLLVAKKPVGWKPKRELSKDELYKLLGQVSPYYASR